MIFFKTKKWEKEPKKITGAFWTLGEITKRWSFPYFYDHGNLGCDTQSQIKSYVSEGDMYV
jgi:hypothetical protein